MRMGQPKQLLIFRGRSLLRHATEEALASGCHPVVVVLGAHAEQMGAEIRALPVRVVVNGRWPEGMGASIRAGIEALTADPGAGDLEAVALAVCDQPFFSARIVRKLIAAHQQARCAIAAATYEGARGVPALFSRSLFPELLALEGAEGARRVIEAHPDQTLPVPFPEGAIDVDTPEEYARVASMPGGKSVHLLKDDKEE
jgi:molybdenum cofactor cytidylyltransferase